MQGQGTRGERARLQPWSAPCRATSLAHYLTCLSSIRSCCTPSPLSLLPLSSSECTPSTIYQSRSVPNPAYEAQERLVAKFHYKSTTLVCGVDEPFSSLGLTWILVASTAVALPRIHAGGGFTHADAKWSVRVSASHSSSSCCCCCCCCCVVLCLRQALPAFWRPDPTQRDVHTER